MSAPVSIQNNVTVEETFMGTAPSGENVRWFTLTNKHGMKACVSNFGATLTHLFVPNRNGELQDVVLGFDSHEAYVSEAYLQSGAFMGCTVGRVCNRIADGLLILEGENIQLDNSNNGQHLHGGKEGFDKKCWEAKVLENGVAFSYLSPDGEENYPGNLKVEVSFTLSDQNELKITYQAQTDKTTVVNLTNHSYFNLSGDFSKTILEHDLQVQAPFYIPVKDKSIPTGEILSVKDSPYDFLETQKVKKAVFADHPQIKIGNGLDQTLVFSESKPGAVLSEETSGIRMEISTSEPGMQIYTANYFDGSLIGKGGKRYPQHGGIALETQHFPDSPNHPHFPSILLKPEDTFESFTTFKFSTNP